MKLKYLLLGIPLSIAGYATVILTEKPKDKVSEVISGWSQSYEKEVYDNTLMIAKSYTEDEQSRINYTSCFVSKLKLKYPNGMQSIIKDSLRKTYEKFGFECASQIKDIAWNDKVKEQLFNSLMQYPMLKDLTLEKRTKFCNCYIKELQLMFPNGLNNQVSPEIHDKITLKCANRVTKEYNSR